MIQSLFTGKDISLRKEEKCASLSQAAALTSGMFGKNVWGGEKTGSHNKLGRPEDFGIRNQKVRETEVIVRENEKVICDHIIRGDDRPGRSRTGRRLSALDAGQR